MVNLNGSPSEVINYISFVTDTEKYGNSSDSIWAYDTRRDELHVLAVDALIRKNGHMSKGEATRYINQLLNDCLNCRGYC